MYLKFVVHFCIFTVADIYGEQMASSSILGEQLVSLKDTIDIGCEFDKDMGKLMGILDTMFAASATSPTTGPTAAPAPVPAIAAAQAQ